MLWAARFWRLWFVGKVGSQKFEMESLFGGECHIRRWYCTWTRGLGLAGVPKYKAAPGNIFGFRGMVLVAVK